MINTYVRVQTQMFLTVQSNKTVLVQSCAIIGNSRKACNNLNEESCNQTDKDPKLT